MLVGALQASPTTHFQSNTILIPHDDKIHRQGEDSAHTCSTLIAVADGVGGWAEHGINPGLFSKALTRGIRDGHLRDDSVSTRDLIVAANQQATSQYEGTATIVALKLDGLKLESSVIGDSGYSLFRYEPESESVKMLYKSKE